MVVYVCMKQMVPEEADDLWLAYNLIAKGDSVLASTVRYLFPPFPLLCISMHYIWGSFI